MGLFDMFKKKDAAPSFPVVLAADAAGAFVKDRKSTRLNSSHAR